jgi:GNAT superfamily N-acetyltransferase
MVEEIKQTETLTAEVKKQLFGWGENIFGVEPLKLSWRPKDLHFLLYLDGRPISHVGVLKHAVSVNDKAVTVAGVGGVVTLPEAQKKGFARLLMQHATSFVEREWKVDAALLFCLPQLAAYYEGLGWQGVESTVLIEQPKGPIAAPLHVMVRPLGGMNWPTGSVELRSFPW